MNQKNEAMQTATLHKHSTLLLLSLSLFLMAASTMTTNAHAADAQPTWQTTRTPMYYGGIPDVSDNYLRPVLIGDADFGYRAYDYKGGFYIATQIAVANQKEIQQHTAFDNIKEQHVYLMHYIPIGRAKPNSWEIQQYRMYRLELPSLQSLDTINFATIANNPDWEWATQPDYLFLWNQLDEQVKELKQADTQKTEEAMQQWNEKVIAAMENESKFDVIGQIKKLKAQNNYDTIVKTGHSTLYVNTDYLCYEIADDPELFYVTKREYYSDGAPKSRSYFFAGVYQSESLPFGPSVAWDKKGKIIHSEVLQPVFFAFNMQYYLKWLEARNYIDPRTGKGKPVMKINTHINPHAPSHGATRVGIESNWQIQIDDVPGTGVPDTVAILIKGDNDKETVFIFSNSSKIIWDKFNR
jgi:hypothetical protein